VPTVHVVAESSLPPARVLAAAHDFSEQRAEVWPAVSVKHLTVHELGETSADVTEGTRAGPIVVWERCLYDWSQPGSVKAMVTDANVYAVPGSSWEIRATPNNGGSRVEMIWAREFKRNLIGRVFGTVFRRFGQSLFGRDARHALRNLERLEKGARSGSGDAASEEARRPISVSLVHNRSSLARVGRNLDGRHAVHRGAGLVAGGNLSPRRRYPVPFASVGSASLDSTPPA
jgi:hypothetical protein